MGHQPWSDYLSATYREYQRSRDRKPGLYPHYTERGCWQLLDASARSAWQGETYEHGNWTAGFWFGTMWLAAWGLDDDGPADLARSRLTQMSHRSTDHTTHDLGFLFHPSIVLGHQLGFLVDEDTQPALEAARMTVRRFNEPGRYIQAFGPVGDGRGAGTSTVDTMMNLPLLWWAHAVTGESRFLEVARQHARTSARLLVRPDGSTIHLMLLDSVTGAFLKESTLQGASAESAWSRGQAWAVCGLAWAFGVTGEPEFLAAAERAVDYFEKHSRLDELPPWDFSDASVKPPTDASAAAAIALGYLILGATHPQASRRVRYSDGADTLIDTIARLALNRDPATEGILLCSNYSVPHNRGLGGATAWGDFYIGVAIAVAEGVITVEQLLRGTAISDRTVKE